MKTKMRMLVLLMIVGATSVFGLVANQVTFTSVGEVTIDSQFTGNWEPIGSLTVVFDSAANGILTISGVAIMDPTDKLYIGFGNDSANRVDSATGATTGQTNSNLDTVLISSRGHSGEKVREAFNIVHIASYTALTDTFYFNLAVGGSSGSEKVQLEDLWIRMEQASKP